MFGVCLPHQSHDTLNMYRNIQEELFSSYDLHYRVIDMAPHELGCQANRKYDIEAWMPGSKRYGEISSCSNCTDYQVRFIFTFCYIMRGRNRQNKMIDNFGVTVEETQH